MTQCLGQNSVKKFQHLHLLPKLLTARPDKVVNYSFTVNPVVLLSDHPLDWLHVASNSCLSFERFCGWLHALDSGELLCVSGFPFSLTASSISDWMVSSPFFDLLRSLSNHNARRISAPFGFQFSPRTRTSCHGHEATRSPSHVRIVSAGGSTHLNTASS